MLYSCRKSTFHEAGGRHERSVIEDLYLQLNAMIRRSRELGNDLHPGLSLVGYTFSSMVDTSPALRASDLAERLGLDKSTVSRQLNQLLEAGLMDRVGGRPGRRGPPLGDSRRPVRPGGRRRSGARPPDRLVGDWDEEDIAAFGALMARFNNSVDASLPT